MASPLERLNMAGVFPRQMKEPVAAYYLSYSVEYFRQKWSDPSSGFPPPRREGRATYWLKDDIDRWLDQQYQLSSSPHDNDDDFEDFKKRFG